MNKKRDVDFPLLVRQIREARGLTQEQLARDLEVTFGTVNGWENGKHRPIQALAARLVRMATEAGIGIPGREAVAPTIPRNHRISGRR